MKNQKRPKRPLRGRVNTVDENDSSSDPRSSTAKSSDGLLRLQSFLAQSGVASRRKAEKFILEGRVTVNGKKVTELGAKVHPRSDAVMFDDKRVQVEPKGLLLLNKPRHVVSTMNDPEGRRCLGDILSKRYRSYFPVGRLDFESNGLVILTNDGDLAEVLMHPRYQIERVYYVKVEGAVTRQTMQQVSIGVKLEDGIARGKVRLIDGQPEFTALEVIVSEGRNRLVRRIFEELGHPVKVLTRLSHGPFKLGSLKAGEICKISEHDYTKMKGKVMAARRGAGAGGRSKRLGARK